MILQMTLLLFMAAAAVKDYRSYWVPNELILAGALNGYILLLLGRWFRRRDRWCDRNGVDFHPLCRFFCLVNVWCRRFEAYDGNGCLYGACKVCTDTDCVTGIWCSYFTVENVEI